MDEVPPKNDEFVFGNYCVSFIDLLGQRDALHAQGLLPEPRSEEEREKLIATLRASIGAIASLQQRADQLLQRAMRPPPNSQLRASLSEEERQTWDAMLQSSVKTQRWSDGLLSFAFLGDEKIKCHLNSVFSLIGSAGALCLAGLATRQPIRGALEIAWGVELHPGELYGAVVARAYELESGVAGYPRVVIGPELLKYLEAHSKNPNDDPFSRNDRALAQRCLEMLLQDADGHWFVDYLGESFRELTGTAHAGFYARAHRFVEEQLMRHQKGQNSKLAFRYAHLMNYFAAFPPPSASPEERD